MLIDKFDVARRRDLSSAKDETWDGLEALGQHFRSQGMLIRFGTNHEAEQRHRENGCKIVRKLLAAVADWRSVLDGNEASEASKDLIRRRPIVKRQLLEYGLGGDRGDAPKRKPQI